MAALLLALGWLLTVGISARPDGGAESHAAGSPGVVVPTDGAPSGEVVLDAGGDRAYVTNPSRDRVEVVALGTRSLEAPIPVGARPLGLDVSADGALLYVANSGGHDVSVIDLALRREVARIPVPSGYFGNETPYSVAVATNGTAPLTTTFPGSGWTPLYQIDLGARTVRQRTDFRSGGQTTEHTRLEASGDRSRIGIVGWNNSGGPVDVYDAATDSFVASKNLSAFVSSVALDRTGTSVLVDRYVLDRDLVLRATLPGANKGLALDASGSTAYRVQDTKVGVADVGRGLVVAAIDLPEPVGEGSGRAALSADDGTLVVLTATGVSVVPTGAAVPIPPCTDPAPTSTLVPVCGAPLADVVVDPTGTRAYATNSERNQVEVVRLATRELEPPIPVGSRPQGLDLSGDGKLLYVANSGANDVSVVDLSLRREVRRITIPSGFLNERPHSIAVARNGTALLTTTFTGTGHSPLWKIDLDSETVRRPERFRSIGNEVSPRSRLEASADRSQIGLVEVESSAGSVYRYDADTDSFGPEKTLARFLSFVALDGTGSTMLVGPDAYVLDEDLHLRSTVPAGGRGLAANGAGTIGYGVEDDWVTVLDLERGLPGATIALPEEVGGGGSVALSPDDGTLVVATAGGLTVAPVSSTVPLPSCTSTVEAVCGAPLGQVVVDAAGARAYITNPAMNQVEVVSLATNRLEAPIAVGSQPRALDLTPDGTTLYVATSGSNFVSVVDLGLRREVRRTPVPSGFMNERPRSIAVANNGIALLATGYGGGSGWTELLEIDLASGAVSRRPDFWGNGRTTADSELRASGDRSRIAVAAGNNSSGPTFVYDAASGSFSPVKHLAEFVTSVALDRDGSTILVDSWVLDRELVQRATINPVRNGGGAVDAGANRAYRLADGSVDVVDLRRGLVVGSLAIPGAATGHSQIALTPDDGRLVVLTSGGLTVVPVAAARPSPACTPPSAPASVLAVCGESWPVSGGPLDDAVVDHARGRAYATNPSRNQVEVVSLATRTAGQPLFVGSQPRGLDLSPDGNLLYVANSGGNDVSVVDLAVGREVRRITVPPTQRNERPLAVAIANNGTALLTTTFSGSGTDSMRQIDLNTGAVRSRTDIFAINAGTSEVTRFAPNADRSRIGMASASGTLLYTAATDAFTRMAEPASCGRYVDLDDSGSTVLTSRCVLDDGLALRASIPDLGLGVAVEVAGTTANRIQEYAVQTIEPATGAVVGSAPLPDPAGFRGGETVLGPGDQTLLVLTGKGISFVPVQEAPPLAPRDPYTVWSRASATPLDGLGSWMGMANDPEAGPGQLPPYYLYAHFFGFANSSAQGVVGLVIEESGKAAVFLVVGPDGTSHTAVVPFDWSAGRWYFPMVHQIGPGRWGAWVFDAEAARWTAVGELRLPAEWGKLAPASVTALLW